MEDLGVEIDALMKRGRDLGHVLRALVPVFPPSYFGGDTIEAGCGYAGTFRSYFYDGLKRYGKEHGWPELALNEIERYCEYSVTDA